MPISLKYNKQIIYIYVIYICMYIYTNVRMNKCIWFQMTSRNVPIVG